jgi:hypothetical protein
LPWWDKCGIVAMASNGCLPGISAASAFQLSCT